MIRAPITRAMRLPSASRNPTPAARITRQLARGYAVAAPAVGSYNSSEPTLNSPSELARRISAKVLPRLEKPDVRKVLVVGSGGLSIGQAGEFDYSGEHKYRGTGGSLTGRISSHQSSTRVQHFDSPYQSQYRYYPDLAPLGQRDLLPARHARLCRLCVGEGAT